MTQLHLGLNLSTKRTRKRAFLDDMRRVVPWSRLVPLIEPHYPKGKTGRPPFPVATMLHIHFIQQWFGLSDPAMEEALYDVPLYREFAGLDGGMTRLPDETTILRFRHLLETYGIAAQIWIFDQVIELRQFLRRSCRSAGRAPGLRRGRRASRPLSRC
jgi:IS5 family transposase